MKILKFRVWDKKNQKFEKTSDGLYFHTTKQVGDLGGISVSKFIEKSDKFVVEQFTGLLDKNEKEIYEGDILLLEDGSKHPVTFLEGAFVLGLSPLYELASGDNAQLFEEVVGNIHENPELTS